VNFNWLLLEYRNHFSTYIRSLLKPDPLLKNNIGFKNLHKNERCFILGSGHSINTQDLSLLNGEIVMTQNHFHAHPEIFKIKPRYHVLIPKYQPKEFDGDWVSWLKSMEDRLPDETNIFLGANTKYLLDETGFFKNRSFFIKSGYSSAIAKIAYTDITRPLMRVPTVLTECLAIAIYMGFKEIYLMGFDLDQNIQLAKGVNRDEIRFYGKSDITNNQAEKNIELAEGASGLDWFSMWTIWEQCNLLKKAAEAANIKIINATNGGVLNVFDRRPYEEVIKPGKKNCE